MIKYKYFSILYLPVLLICLCSCKKYLETKSVQTLSTPETLDDLQMLLDNSAMNRGLVATNSSTDEYYLRYNDYLTRNEVTRNTYVWDKNLNDFDDWYIQYNTIFYANTVLFNLEKIGFDPQDQKSKNIKGSALFYRAYSFFQLSQLYAPQYNTTSALSDLGIPLRLDVDFDKPSERATVKQNYDQIINNLEEALQLLPETPLVKSRPGKAACYAQLTRTYLQMENYSLAKENANAALQIQNTLLDFNQPPVVPSSSSPIPIFNSEVIYYTSSNASINSNSRARIDSVLYQSYDNNDLRKTVFYRSNGDGTFRFKGSYNGGSVDLFNGLAVDEMYLSRAECYAREGDVRLALNDLNSLLSKRWKTGTFVPFIPTTANQALGLILQERKKELVFRGTRWADLRRLNRDTRFAITLKRNLNGQIFELPPNDLRYTLLIPREVTNIINLIQNPR